MKLLPTIAIGVWATIGASIFLSLAASLFKPQTIASTPDPRSLSPRDCYKQTQDLAKCIGRGANP